MAKKSPAAETAFKRIKDQYKEAGHPPRETAGFAPEPDDVPAYKELAALGLLEKFTASSWLLTERGLAAVMA